MVTGCWVASICEWTSGFQEPIFLITAIVSIEEGGGSKQSLKLWSVTCVMEYFKKSMVGRRACSSVCILCVSDITSYGQKHCISTTSASLLEHTIGRRPSSSLCSRSCGTPPQAHQPTIMDRRGGEQSPGDNPQDLKRIAEGPRHAGARKKSIWKHKWVSEHFPHELYWLLELVFWWEQPLVGILNNIAPYL